MLYGKLSTTTIEMKPDSIEHHIARVMLENINQLSDIPIGKMAEMCAVSKSTISKFVRELGYEDYMEFKAEAFGQRKKEIYIKGANTVNITDYILKEGMEQYLKTLFYDIHYMIESLDQKKIEQVVTDIHEYREIASFGEGYSETAAMNLQHKMTFYRKFVYTTPNDRMQDQYIGKAGKGTLLLIFSNSGRYLNVHQESEGTRKKNCFDETDAKVILFTSNKEMEKDPRVDLCISWRYSDKVQNHPVIFQILIEKLASEYQRKYGFPMETI